MSDSNLGDDELVQKQHKHCKDVLNRIKRSTYASPFKEPVDPEKLGCPDYFEKIKNPMDLSTIKTKLDKDGYSPEQFRQDFQLMLSNCYTYNPEGTYVNKCGREIEKLFDGLYAALPAESAKRRKVDKKNFDECHRILSEVLKPRHRKITWPFLEPVDAKLVPNYYDIIKNPMDLSLVQKRLNAHEYDSKEDFDKDIRLIVNNSLTYNTEGSEVYRCGTELQSLVHSISEQDEGTREQIDMLRSKIRAMEKEIDALQARLDNVKNYTANDRVEIARQIEKLPEASMHAIIKIIQRHKKDLDLTQPEVEVDLKHLSNKALEEIDKYLSTNKENLDEDSSSTI